MTIKKLRLKNFRSHLNTTLRFHPNVNVIVGLSRSGKTSLVRALQFVVFNRPSGTSYYPKFLDESGKTEVEVKFNDGSFVRLKKHITVGKKSNKKKTLKDQTYVVKTESETRSFRSFKSNVPPEVQQVLKLNELNIQTQLEQHFAVSSGGSKLSKTINEITGLQRIDELLTKTESEIRRTNQRIELESAEIKSIEKLLATLKDTDKIKKLIDRGKRINKKISAIEKEAEQIEKIIEVKKKRLKIEKKIKLTSSLLEKAKAKKFLLIVILRKLQRIDDLTSEVLNAISIQKKIEQTEERLRETKLKLKRTVKSVKVCPFCGSKLTKEHYNWLVKEKWNL